MRSLLLGAVLVPALAFGARGAWPGTATPAQVAPGFDGSGRAQPLLEPDLRVGVTGRLQDLATGGPLPGAEIMAAGVVARSDAAGRFALKLPPGRYDFRARADGFGGASAMGVLATGPGVTVTLGLAPMDPSPAAALAVVSRLRAREAGEMAATEPVTRSAAAAPVTEVPDVIRVLMPDGQIVAMDTDEYLKGVVPAEMGYVFRRGLEALKAQAIASRTYAASGCLANSAGDLTRCEPGLDANVDTTTRTQVWRPVHYDVSDEAVRATHGQVARDGEALIRALFFARTSLTTLDSEASPCCGGFATAYLRAVSSPEAFGQRWGHGAGMSQEGAAVLGAWGATAEEIIEHYYTGVRVRPPGRPRLYDVEVSPRLGNVFEPIRFSVDYADPDGDPPVSYSVLIGGVAREMRGPERPEHDFRLGATYTYSTTLPVGQHSVVFHFDDGYSEPVSLDAGVVVVAPLPLRPPGSSEAVDGDLGPPDGPAVPPAPGEVRSGEAEAVPGAAELPPDGGTQAGRLDLVVDEMTRVLVAGPPGTSSASDSEADLAAWLGPPRAAAFPFMAVAGQWSGPEPAEGHVDLEVRTSGDGVAWSPWGALPPEEVDVKVPPADGEYWTRLVLARGRYLQARAVWHGEMTEAPDLEGVTVHYFNGEGGPLAPPAAAQQAEPSIISRAAWGADERLRFNASGAEIWPVVFTRPLAEVVHHTVTVNDPADPAAVVRTVYYFHAVTRGWGDIGYNYLIDHRGNIYEGRFGGERDGRVVQGGHARDYNPNTIGVALLGSFSTLQPSAAARAALESLLAAKGLKYGIWPNDPVTLLGNRFAHSLMGHRDVGTTECPGNAFYPSLPSLRQAVDARMREQSAATATAGPTSSPTATRAPASATRPPATRPPPPTLAAGCADLVVGGDFETEEPRWQRHRAAYTAYDAFRGARAMFVGLRNDEPDSGQTFASVQQALRLPPRLGTARLHFALQTRGHDGDRHLVRVLDANGSLLALGGLAVPLNSDWTVYAYDLSGVLAGQVGQEIRLYFGTVNNGDGLRSYLRLDDVSLQVCEPLGPGSPSTTPTTPPTASPMPVTTGTPSPWPPSPTATASPTALEPSPTGTPVGAQTPTGIPVDTVTPAPTATPVCTNLLPEGDFELPDLGFWLVSGNQPAQRVSAPVASGQGALVLGLGAPGSDAFGYAAVARDMDWPAAATRATLSLDVQPLALGPGDAFVVELRRPSDGLRQVLLGPVLADPVGRWTRHVLDLNPAGLGPEVQLYLAVLNRAQAAGPGAVTAVAVDELALEVCVASGQSARRVFLPHTLRGLPR